jgi:hypothetical protein
MPRATHWPVHGHPQEDEKQIMAFEFLPPEDELQIRNLIARYAFATDAGEGEAFADLFIEAGTWTRANSPRREMGGSGLPAETKRGRDALIQLIFESAVKRFDRKARHQMTDILVEPGDAADEAKVQFRALVTTWNEGPGKIGMSVHYHSRCVRTADKGWLFADVSARVLPE